MYSPFPYERISTKDEFFGRTDAFKKINDIVKYSNNLLIYSKRRMGKSSLIKNFFAKHEKKYTCIYVDIFDIASKEDFASSLLTALSNATTLDIKSAIKTISDIFKRVRIEPTINSKNLNYSLKPIVTALSFEEMMEDFFELLLHFSEKKQVILAIDEFQQIASIKDIKLDAYLRKHIQEQQNISWIFLGSKRHLLTSLFEYKAPLYELATPYELPPLKFHEIKKYVSKFLKINDDDLQYLCEYAKFETKLMQHVFHILYTQKEKSISKEMIDLAYEEILNAKSSSYELLFDTLNNNQKKALKIIGKYKKNLFSNEILTEFHIKKQTLQSALNSLFQKEIIDKDKGGYFMSDTAFELWCEGL